MDQQAKIVIFGMCVALIGSLIPMGLHQVSEGHVGVYWRGGALMPTISNPGFHLKLPVVTTFAEVQVSVQTDAVSSIPCGTSGGVMITFDRVEVVNRLQKEMVHDTIKNYTVAYDKTWIFDKIHHEINQFCSSHTLQEVYIEQFDTLDESLALAIQRDCNLWAPGIEIIAVRVTKPRIPEQIRRNFEAMEAEKTKLLIATETQLVVEKEAQTESMRATIEAQKTADVSRINMEKEIAEQKAKQEIFALENEMHLARERSLADAEFYKHSKEAEANEKRFTPEFLEYQHILSLSNNTKVYFGEKIPSMYIEKSPVGSGGGGEKQGA